jgi:integrase
LLALRWRHVDFHTERVVVERSLDLNERVEQPTKSYKTRSVGLAPEVLTVLAQHRNRSEYEDDADLVFAAWDGTWLEDGEVRAGFYAALAATGLGHKRQGSGAERFTFHNLRHTFGTTLARGGVDVHRIQRLMGHAHISTTLVYMHYAPSKDEGAQISAAFAGAFEMPVASAAALAGAAHD